MTVQYTRSVGKYQRNRMLFHVYNYSFHILSTNWWMSEKIIIIYSCLNYHSRLIALYQAHYMILDRTLAAQLSSAQPDVYGAPHQHQHSDSICGNIIKIGMTQWKQRLLFVFRVWHFTTRNKLVPFSLCQKPTKK